MVEDYYALLHAIADVRSRGAAVSPQRVSQLEGDLGSAAQA